MYIIPSQCKLCINFDDSESLCKIHEQLPGEYGREDIKDCPSFLERTNKNEEDLHLLLQYIDESPDKLDQSISNAVERILYDYENKYKVLIVGIARRKIKSIIKMVDIIDVVIDRLSSEEMLSTMAPSQSLRLLSELNHSINNDLTFIMKLVNPDTKLADLQMWIDARAININNGVSAETEVKADDIMKLTGASRDKVRDAFDALLTQIKSDDDTLIEVDDVKEIDEDE